MRQGSHPGPGMLPPLVADELHYGEHTLFSVIANLPPSAAPEPAESTSSSPPRRTSPAPPSITVSSADEVRMAVPHPNAYYCPRENGWVILSWKNSSVAPPLARSFKSDYPLPRQDYRRSTTDCVGDKKDVFEPLNTTHHFHRYQNAIDSRKLTPPLLRDWWERDAERQRKRDGAVLPDDFDPKKLTAGDIDGTEDGDDGRLFDLYICCQCQLYIVASNTIPGVIPRDVWDEFIKEKTSNPPPGFTARQSAHQAIETILLAIENHIYKGKHKPLRTDGSAFQKKLGYGPVVKELFTLMGFTQAESKSEVQLRPPEIDPSVPQGKINRQRLLRAWVEISAWLCNFRKLYRALFFHAKGIGPLTVNLADALDNKKNYSIHVQLEGAREMYQTAIGAHVDQIPRGLLSQKMVQAQGMLEADVWPSLGLTPSTYSPDLLAFGYLAQCRCDPANTMKYFTYFSSIQQLMASLGESVPPKLSELAIIEASRNRFTKTDFELACHNLGFGADGFLGLEYDDDIDDEFVANAFRERVKEAVRDAAGGAQKLRDAKEAFRMVAEARGSVTLHRLWEESKSMMTAEKAYMSLEIPADTEDEMVITVFNMRLEERPHEIDRMREAMQIIAEVRDSERLRQFALTGRDPGYVRAPIRPDLPRGLNQLSNTCYLNSLLQYFYTIKDLREAVRPMFQADAKILKDDKMSDDELKKHRVGGRLVTRREIVRSRKFISQLASLFHQLEHDNDPSITPTIELAKLALVTSKDEEEDEVERGGTASSNDTDATLVDDVTSPGVRHSSPVDGMRSPGGTVLGKRPRKLVRGSTATAMDEDTPVREEDGYVMVPSPPTSPRHARKTSATLEAKDKDGDVSMRTATPQVETKPAAFEAVAPRDDEMMFGRQHDVAECMDNCMFQIETALLRFDGSNGPESSQDIDKTSVVKRLFYGKLRQRIVASPGSDPAASRSSIHEKEDLFSHLPVNVTEDGTDIYDGLSGYFYDTVEFEGKKSRMEVELVDMPPLLQVQLQRVQFNRETLQPFKNQAYVKFGETVYMDRYLDSSDPQKKMRSRAIQHDLTACRDRLRLLQQGKGGMPYHASLGSTVNFLSRQQGIELPEADTEFMGALQAEQGYVQLEMESLQKQIVAMKTELESIWAEDKEAAYELTSVFIHRGTSPSWGHYFFYSRNLPAHPEQWFKYNDSDVTVVDRSEVFADTTGDTANPYLLVFARKGCEVVDTVKRAV
ncbi:hypothetical protein BD626DRAFT_405576 [Schizophyllum amplum]|uniref:ubiquitinyl hydrolase 1 n=1 Tax=Schizophyllum amplum TaxID=97359 RepID=A0A550CA12_9AGAR|nr:hypothetical protein BD626DRAFT_405576 [Auriculariopsis ampla]